jgi:hypothetical protein
LKKGGDFLPLFFISIKVYNHNMSNMCITCVLRSEVIQHLHKRVNTSMMDGLYTFTGISEDEFDFYYILKHNSGKYTHMSAVGGIIPVSEERVKGVRKGLTDKQLKEKCSCETLAILNISGAFK